MPALVLGTGLSRLPVGINSLGVLLYVQEQQSSFGVAGIVVSAMALGSATGGPDQGRLVDRRGPSLLLALSGIYAAALGCLLVSCGGAWPVAVQAFAGFLVGGSLPITTSVLRARWPQLLHDRLDLLPAAFSLDSLLIELSFVLGPAITAAAVAISGAGSALVLSGLLGLVAPLVFTAALLRHAGGAPAVATPGRRSIFGPLTSPGIRALSLASVPFGCYLGSLDVALPAYAEKIGSPALAGVMLAILALASAAAVLIYGIWRPSSHLWDVHLRFSLLLAISPLPLLASSTPIIFSCALVLAGAPIAPTIASRNQLVREVAPAGTEAEAFAWPLTAMICGISIGAALGGQLVELEGWRAPIVAGAAISALGVASLFAFGRPQALGLASGRSGSPPDGGARTVGGGG